MTRAPWPLHSHAPSAQCGIVASRAYLIDLDGTIYRGNEPIAHAREFLEHLGRNGTRYLLMTNCPSHTRHGLVDRLARMGIAVRAEDIVTSAMVTAAWLRGRGVRTAYVVCEPAAAEELTAAGIRVDGFDGTPDAVVCGFDRSFTYRKLDTAARHIRAGALFVGTNPDPVIPDGPDLVPHSLPIIRSVQACVAAAPVIIGKPERHMFDYADALCRADAYTVVGDRLDTDVAFARRSGARSVLVLTGTTRREEAVRGPVVPDEMVDSLQELMR
jgi:4-nitrophenyl phosphatase